MRDCGAELAVLIDEQPDVFFPAALMTSSELADGPQEPVAALERERPALFARQSTADGIFPICCVHGHFPDVMPPWTRPPCRLAGGYSADRAEKRGTMPRPTVESLVNRREQQGEGAEHLRLLGDQGSPTLGFVTYWMDVRKGVESEP